MSVFFQTIALYCLRCLIEAAHLQILSGVFILALEGDALKAIELTEQLAPGLLDNSKDLHFDLLTLHFVKLVCSRKW